MSYTISINGHGATSDQVRAAAQAVVDSLAGTGSVTGSASGSGPDGQSFTHSDIGPSGSQATDATDATDAPDVVTDGPHLEAGQREGGDGTDGGDAAAATDQATDAGDGQPAPPVTDQVPYGTPAP